MSVKPLIIGLTGLAHSGKDTTADYLLTKLSPHYRVAKVALADRLKLVCQKLVKLFYNIELPISDFYDTHKKETVLDQFPLFAGQPFKIRTILQLIGTEIFRDMIGTAVWCQVVKEHYIDVNLYDIIIISDIRMPDEFQFFKHLPNTRFMSFRLVRPNRDPIDLANQKHSTERYIMELPVEREIMNDSSHQSLYQKLDLLIEEI